jgi:DNA-binding NtrC family response regulator
MAKVLLVDDELTMVQMVSEMLRGEGHEVIPCTNSKDALAALETHHPEVVVTDLYLDKTRPHGLDILQKARSISPPATVIVITAFGTIETAVEAMKNGAYDYLEKPFKLNDLSLCVKRALFYSEAISENFYLRKELKKKYEFSQLIGTSSEMQKVFKMIERVAGTDSTILILGESGTGKELVARALHYNSRRQLAPFIPVNCSALPEALLESELFGHRRGSFTGAFTDKKGLFQEADGGTVFLDEVGSMSPTLQSRLLRVLQEREVRRVGENTPTYINVRVLAATNEPLEEKIKQGSFREDLYYRLNVIAINLPSMRERKEDIPLLVSHFLRQRTNQQTGQTPQLTREAMEILKAHDWPGNVREIENAIERACALCEGGVIKAEDLPPLLLQKYGGKVEKQKAPGELAHLPGADEARQSGQKNEFSQASARPDEKHAVALKDFMREQELVYINETLIQVGGDKEKAAERLGISLATLYRKLTEGGKEGE